MLTKVKDPVPPEKRIGVIYKIGCICGDVYIGETSRLMSTRIKEHKAACRLGNFERSAVAEHAWQDGHCQNIRHSHRLHKQKHKGRSSYKAKSNTYMQKENGWRDLSLIWLSTLRSAPKTELFMIATTAITPPTDYTSRCMTTNAITQEAEASHVIISSSLPGTGDIISV